MGLFDRFLGPPSEEKFAKQFLAELSRAGFDDPLEYDAENFCLRNGKQQNRQVFNLRNFYLEHCNLPRSERHHHIRHTIIALLSSQQELPDEYEHAKPDLRLKLWCRTAIEKMRLQRKIDGDDDSADFVLDQVGEHLVVSVVYDFPDSVRSVSREELEDWGVTPYEAMEDARQNLLEDEFAFASIGESLYASVTGDSYDASRILLLDLIRKLSVNGDRIALVPTRNSLLLTGSRDENGLVMMLDLAEEATEDPHPMLFTPLRLDGENWVDWMPPATHPLHARFRFLELKYFHPEYEEQKALLDELYEQDGTDIFVASYTAIQRDDDSVFSYCVWSKGIESLLPKTNTVMFFEEGKDIVASGDWDRVVEIVGDLMEETNLFPPRYRVWSFPTDEQLTAIGQVE